MSGKAFFIDATRCTACRGCQIACKEWNQLPAEKTSNWGSHQNPADLSHLTWKLIRFSEMDGPNNRPVWLFFADQCRHCLDAPCQAGAEGVPGAIVVDQDTGAVIHTKLLQKVKYEDVLRECPYNIPRADPKTNIFVKCTMCLDRVGSGLPPACVKSCPTGAMNFGDRDKMVALAQERFEARKKVNPNAELTGIQDLRVFHLLDHKPEDYYEYARNEPSLTRMQALKKMFKPLGRTLPKSLLG
ncbi:MAG: 4Fe-4S dicluster domain-containing protein [Pseudomonadota bacterium]